MHKGQVVTAKGGDVARLAALGYKQELSRVLSRFDNFSVAFTYFVADGGDPLAVRLRSQSRGTALHLADAHRRRGHAVRRLGFGELGSHYPVAAALYQYSNYTVGPGYGWWVGWFYGVALLVTVAVDTGVPYVASLSNNWFVTSLDPTNHTTILLVTLALLAVQTTLNIIGAKMMGRVASVGTYVEILGTVGIAIILAIAGFHHGFGFLFSTQGAEHLKTNPLGVELGGNWWTGAALVAILAHVYIGLVAYVVAKPWQAIARHLHDDLEPTGAERG